MIFVVIALKLMDDFNLYCYNKRIEEKTTDDIFHIPCAQRMVSHRKDRSKMSLNMDYLSNFITAAEYRNFTAAADRLFINQSTLSRQVQSLEESLETPLFIRNGKNLTLTKAGQMLYETGQTLLDNMRQVESLVRDAASYENNRVIIYSIPAFLDATALVYRRLRDKGIAADVIIHHLQAEDPKALLSSNAVDFLIMFDRFMENNDEMLDRIPFAREGFCVVCAPDHPFALHKSLTFREASSQNVLFGLGFPGLYPQKQNRKIDDDVITHKTLESHHDAVLLGEGILILPIVCARCFASDLAIVPISDLELQYNIELVYKKNRPLTPTARAYAEEIRAVGAEVFGPV